MAERLSQYHLCHRYSFGLPYNWLSCTRTVIALSTLPLIRTTTRPDNARLKLWLNASIRTACPYASSPCRTVTTRTVTSRPAPHEAISSTASTRLERYDRAPHFASLLPSQCLSISALATTFQRTWMNRLVPLQSALSPHSQARLKRLCTSVGKKNLAPLAPRSVRFQSALIRRLAENSHPALPQKWEIFQ